jgi:hypothetical protein
VSVLPSIELRIANLIKALSQVVLPAIDPRNALAREQAQLAIGHLQLIALQWRKAAAFEAQALATLRELGEQLADAAAGGGGTMQAAAALREALTLGRAYAELGGAIDRLIRAASADAAPDFRARLDDAVLAHGALQAWRERVWFAATGLDPDARALPSIDEMLRGARP